MTSPTLKLPPAVGKAMEAVAGPKGSDRAWFEARPGRRWRIRPSEPAEHQTHELLDLMTADGSLGHGCGRCQPYVLVLTSPSLDIRLRFFGADPSLVPTDWMVEAISAETDAAFVRAVAPYLRGRGAPEEAS